MTKEEFQFTWAIIILPCGCVALGWHLAHGFYSAFHNLGLGTHRYKNIIKVVSVAFSVIVPLIFALMPVAFICNG